MKVNAGPASSVKRRQRCCAGKCGLFCISRNPKPGWCETTLPRQHCRKQSYKPLIRYKLILLWCITGGRWPDQLLGLSAWVPVKLGTSQNKTRNAPGAAPVISTLLVFCKLLPSMSVQCRIHVVISRPTTSTIVGRLTASPSVQCFSLLKILSPPGLQMRQSLNKDQENSEARACTFNHKNNWLYFCSLARHWIQDMTSS